MGELTLSYKGYSLTVPYSILSYYVRTPLVKGKTLYQLLFEHLIDEKVVAVNQLLRLLKEKGPKAAESISQRAIKDAIRKIEAALANPKNRKSPKGKAWPALRFKRQGRGGATPVLLRRSKRSRLTEGQKEVIDCALKQVLTSSKAWTWPEIRDVCRQALVDAGADTNVGLRRETLACRIKSVMEQNPKVGSQKWKPHYLRRQL